MEKARAHIVFRGRVQGVFFRAFARQVAESLDVAGWVRNLYDGSVEAVFEGDRALVTKAIEKCRKGPPGAHVDEAEVEWESFAGEFSGFRIRY